MAVRVDVIGEQDSLGWSNERREATFLPEPDPAELFCPLISVDDHFLEPPEVFDLVPTRYRDAVPRVEEDDLGIPYWIIDDTRVPITLNNAVVGRPMSEWSFAPQKWNELRPGCWDVHARVRDMDINGVFASLNFPSAFWGFAGKVFAGMRDQEVGLEAMRAYNRWVLEEWCGAYPDRFIPCQVPWLADAKIAAGEVRANAERGFRSITFSENPEALGYPSIYSDHWDPFFAACQETGTVLNLHVGSSGTITRPSAASPTEVLVALFPLNGMMALVDWMFAKIPVRFPDIRIALSEGGVSWVPMVIERLRRAYRLRDASPTWSEADGDPVDILHRNFWFTSIEDPSAFRQLDIIGADRVMVEADYPHMDSSWPDTQGLVRTAVEDLDRTTIQKVCYENAAGLYRHPLPPEDLLARSIVGRPAT